MSELEYDTRYRTWLQNAGGAPGDPVNIKGLLKDMTTLMGAAGGGVKPAQVGNGATAGAHLWSGSGAPSSQTFTSTTGDIYFRTDGGAATAIYIATAGGTPGTWTAVT